MNRSASVPERTAVRGTAPPPPEGSAAALDSTDVPIQSVTVSAYTVPTDAPEADGTLAWSSTTMVLVEAWAGDAVGVGWTYGPPALVDIVRHRLADVVTGRSALDVTGNYHAMAASLRNDGRPGACAMALSAVDLALWDLKARLLDLPLHRLLGQVRDAVPVYGSGGFTSYTDRQLRDQLEGWGTAGFTAVKIKVGEDHGTQLARDTSRVRQARSVLGPRTELFVDANGAYRAQQAINWFRRLDESGVAVTWFEEPVSSDDLSGLARIRDAVSADVTAGEYGYDLSYFQRMLAADAVDCLQIDVTRCGGITEWLRIAAVAASRHVDVSGHCAPHAHAAVAAATPNLRHLEWFHDHSRIEALFFDGAPQAGAGQLGLTEAAGNGLVLRREQVERFRVS
jgi:L-alanine-DL-glutamate epimerase-like enolase superfamily enzyme